MHKICIGVLLVLFSSVCIEKSKAQPVIENALVRKVATSLDFIKPDYHYLKLPYSSKAKLEMANNKLFAKYEYMHAIAYMAPSYLKRHKEEYKSEIDICKRGAKIYFFEYSNATNADSIFSIFLQQVKKTGTSLLFPGKIGEDKGGTFICRSGKYIIWMPENCSPNPYYDWPPVELKLMQAAFSKEALQKTTFINADCGDYYRIQTIGTFYKIYDKAIHR